jgi:hypothetical protein
MLVSGSGIPMVGGGSRENGSGGGLRGSEAETPTVRVQMTSDTATTPESKVAQVLATTILGSCEVIVSKDDGRERRC